MADGWFKLNMDIFSNRKIKYLRRLPDGNNIVLFWIALLAEARRCNSDGNVFLTESIPYTTEMLADEFSFDKSTVQTALDTFEQLDMISRSHGFITIAGWEDHQNIEGLAKVREQNRIRKQRQRENRNSLPNVSRDSHGTGHGTVTQCHATEEEKEIEEDIEKEIYISIVSFLNEKAGTKFKPTTAKTKSAIKARLAEGFKVDDFKTVIDKKCAEWIGDEKMEKYLRPETLFGTKFEGYLNAKTTGRKNTDGQTSGNSSEVRYGNYI